MDRLISCEFNMDNACVELKFANGSVVTLSLPAMKKSSRNLAMSREPIICKYLLPVV